MKTFKNILGKLSGAFPYIYFSLVALQIFSDHLNETGTFWSESLILLIASVFIIQLKYKFKHIDATLGLFTLFWSCWMVLAAYSDAIKIEYLTWTMNKFLVVAFIIMNFVCSISLLIKRRQVNQASKNVLA